MTPLLTVEDLSIGFGGEDVVENVNFSVPPGQTLALVGESGSGKTVTCRAVLRILPKSARIRSGRITLNGRGGPLVLSDLSERRMRGGARRRGVDDLPGADALALAAAPDRKSGLRGALAAQGSQRTGGPRARS